MPRELYVLSILTVFLVQSTNGYENPSGTCYKYNNGSEPAPLNCCDRLLLENPCNLIDCRDGQVCELVYTSTTDTEACAENYLPLRAECRVQCDSPKPCDEGCHLFKDSNGCDSCYCDDSNFNNPCIDNKPCDEYEECVLQEVECFTDPCYPVADCQPRIGCPRKTTCPTNCLTYKDSDGCPRCYCCNACVNKSCPRRQHCVLDKVMCKQCPCPPVARCE